MISISTLQPFGWILTVFKLNIFLKMEGKTWFSDYWVSRPTKKDFSNLKLKRKSSDWFSLLTYFMENFIKFSIHWIFAQKNGLFLCSKHCQKVLIKYSWIFPMVDIISYKKLTDSYRVTATKFSTIFPRRQDLTKLEIVKRISGEDYRQFRFSFLRIWCWHRL